MSEFNPGDRVRVCLESWDGPGVLVYRVELVLGEEAILREPKIPGLTGITRSFPVSQLVAA